MLIKGSFIVPTVAILPDQVLGAGGGMWAKISALRTTKISETVQMRNLNVPGSPTKSPFTSFKHMGNLGLEGPKNEKWITAETPQPRGNEMGSAKFLQDLWLTGCKIRHEHTVIRTDIIDRRETGHLSIMR